MHIVIILTIYNIYAVLHLWCFPHVQDVSFISKYIFLISFNYHTVAIYLSHRTQNKIWTFIHVISSLTLSMRIRNSMNKLQSSPSPSLMLLGILNLQTREVPSALIVSFTNGQLRLELAHYEGPIAARCKVIWPYN